MAGGTGLCSLFFVTTAATALNTVYFKCMMNCFRSAPGGREEHDYAAFVSVFDIVLWAVLMSAVARLAGCPLDTARFERKRLLRAAGADQLCTLLATVGAAYVPGQAQVLLNQAVLPVTMVMSLALGRRYSSAESVGAMLVLAGATTAAGLSPEMAPEDDALHTGVVIFSLAQVAAAGAGIVKEQLLQELKSKEGAEAVEDPVALGVAIAWVRVPLGVGMALLLRRSEGTLWAEFRDGMLCFLGGEPRPGDEGCSTAARSTLLSVSFYAAQTLLGLRLTQRGSATLRSIAAVTAVPMAQLLFTSDLVMTDAGAEAFGKGSALGLGLCLGGFSIYLNGRQQRPPAAAKVRLLDAEDGGK